MTRPTNYRAALEQALDALHASQAYVEASSNAKLLDGWGNQLDDAEKALTAGRAALATQGEIRLWDSQWTNVVNHDNCYAGWSKEDAVNHAVKMTEKYIAENVAQNKFPAAHPQAREPAPDPDDSDINQIHAGNAAQPAQGVNSTIAFSDRVIAVFTAINGTASDGVMDSIRLASAQAFSEHEEPVQGVNAELVDALREIAELESAERTLKQLGYTNEGGQYWKPPIGKTPNFDLVDTLRASFDELAAAVGWTKERGEQTGDSPMDVANTTRAKLEALRGQEPYAWVNYRVIVHDGECVGYEGRTVSFERLSYGYDWNKARPLYAAPVAPAQPAAGVNAELVRWSDRILKAHPNSDPEFWPPSLKCEYMQAEIIELHDALANAQAAQQKEPS